MERATTRRHLLAAVCALGTEKGTMEERLRTCYERGLSRVSRNPGLPAHLQAEYDELMAGLAWLFEKGRKPGPRESSALAKRIVALYDRFIKES
jgi:hypothetical protein